MSVFKGFSSKNRAKQGPRCAFSQQSGGCLPALLSRTQNR